MYSGGRAETSRENTQGLGGEFRFVTETGQAGDLPTGNVSAQSYR